MNLSISASRAFQASYAARPLDFIKMFLRLFTQLTAVAQQRKSVQQAGYPVGRAKRGRWGATELGIDLLPLVSAREHVGQA